jgi:4-amino-4-deoxy-L-arabinose transferase-like glycosyltransferase
MPKNNTFFIGIIFIFSISIAFLYFKFLPIFPLAGDAIQYDSVAQNLSIGRGFSSDGSEPTALLPPIYPFFLSFIYYILGYNHNLVILAQFILLGLIGSTVYFIGKKYLNLPPLFCFAAALLILIWPYFILYSTFILTEILYTFFLITSIFLLLNFIRQQTGGKAILLAVMLGITALTRQVILFLPIWILVFLLVFRKENRNKDYFKKVVLILALFFVTILPWTVRNYIEFDKILPITSVVSPVFEKSYVNLDYTEGSTALEPGQADLKTIILARIKNIYLFWNPGVQGEYARQLVQVHPAINILFLIYKVVFFTLLALAFFSLKFIRKKEILTLWGVIFYFWTFHTLLFPYPRYTLPIIPLVIVLALFSFNYLSSQYKMKYISG